VNKPGKPVKTELGKYIINILLGRPDLADLTGRPDLADLTFLILEIEHGYFN
jgi:hypothetical protein